MNESVEYYPFTHPQKAIWYTEKVYPGTSIGNIAYTIKFKGEIDYKLLEKSLNIFIENNDAMRLRVIEHNGEPKQYLAQHQYHKFDFFDFSGMDIEEIYKWEEQQSQTPFNSKDADLFYCALIKIDDNTGGIFGRNHHLIADAWTMTVMSDQVVENYIKLKNNIEISKDKKPSYIDYIASEEEYKKSERFEKDKEYWNNKFETIPVLISLKERGSKVMSTKARRKTLLVPKKLTTKIQQYCKKNRSSAYTLFIAALSMYLNRITVNDDIILGTTILNRSNIKEKNMVGMFSNVVPIRIKVDDDIDFDTFVEVVSKESLSLLRHQKYPYHLFLRDIRERQKTVHDLFEIVLNYQNSKFNKDRHSEEYLTRWHFNGHQNNMLIININDREEEGHLIIDYDYLTDLFHVKEVEFIHQHIVNLLWHALDNTSKKISELEMLSEKEKHKILYEFKNKKDIYPMSTTANAHTSSGGGISGATTVYPKDEVIDSISEELANGNKGYILDKNLNLMPIGIAGELYISISDNNLITEKEILENPYELGEKMYKTGCIARWYPDGDIEYLREKESINKQEQETQVKIAATFTSEPIGSYIQWWGKNFGHNLKVEFSGYNQVFQELLKPDSMLSKNKDGINILMIRFEDFIRDNNQNEEEKIIKLEQIFKELEEAINRFSNKAPIIMPIFPVSTHLGLSYAVKNKINKLNKSFEEIVLKHKNIYKVKLNNTQDLYCIEEVFDEIKDREGHMPFTEEYYAAMGTELARIICAIKNQHFKVIILDCDGTLWDGICGEQGALGVKIEGAYRKLQKFMLQKHNEGMLLAICSKNNQKDVQEVFDKNPQMILNKKHIVSWKVNWKEKSDNLKDIAYELNLGLDSFIYVDDSLLECEKIVDACPEVLTLGLPSEEEYIPLFLRHVWAFDRVKVTKEDTLRNSMYVAEQKRKEIKGADALLDEFIKSLELRVSMRLIKEDEIDRASQLTQRTNQFNLSVIRRTESQIRKLSQDNRTKCFVVEASDKFGDYGIIGLVILKEENDKLFIDTFLLSCRILGRRVENVILSGIRRYAIGHKKNIVEAVFIPTEKNKPISEFIENLKWDIVEKNKNYIRYNTSVNNLPEQIEHIEMYYNRTYEKTYDEIHKYKENKTNSKECKKSDTLGKKQENKKVALKDYNLYNTKIVQREKYKEYFLPINYFTGKKLLELPMYEYVKSELDKYEAPTNEMQERMIKIWEDVAKRKNIGINTEFFELGEDSLAAVIIISIIHKEFDVELTIKDIFEFNTVRKLSEKISELKNKESQEY